MANWRIEYELIDRSVNKNDSFRRTAAFHTHKWSRDAVNRDVLVFGVSRTVPANERKELQKCASSKFAFTENQVEAIKESVRAAVGKILGKDISQYSHIRVDQKGLLSLLTGYTETGDQYSEFHFGAGESSIIRMVMKIESLADNSLILIEEIENGLHPVATVRMVEYLVDVAARKSAQAIFTTHSNEALKPLPDRAIWSAISGRIFQGKLDIAALRTISGQIDATLAIFCEDDFAENWIRAVLRAQGNIALDGVEVHGMKGDGTAVKVNKHHNMDPSAKFASVCFIDGDSPQKESEEERVFRLPGQSPEAFVFDSVVDMAQAAAGVLTVRLLQPFSSADKVVERLRHIRLTNHDPHVLFSQSGLDLGLVPESTIRDAFVSTWAEFHAEEAKKILAPIGSFLPVLS